MFLLTALMMSQLNLNTTGMNTLLQVNDTCITKIMFDHFHKIREVQNESIVVTIFPYTLILLSMICTLFGRQIMKPSVALIGFFGGSLAVIQLFYSTTQLHQQMECYVIIAICIVVGACAALVMTCLIKAAAFILGAATGSVVVYAIFDAFPALDYPIWPDAPIIMNYRLVPFWSVTLSLALIGGIGARRKYKEMMSLITSILGAWGVVLGLRMILNEHEISVSEGVYMAIFCMLAFVGLGSQYLQKRRKNRIKRNKTLQNGTA